MGESVEKVVKIGKPHVRSACLGKLHVAQGQDEDKR
jgi:hypothetical protein